MSKTEKAKRVTILVIVLAFVVSSLGLSGLVIWDAAKGNDQNSQAEDLQKQLEEQQKNSSAGKKLEGYEPIASAKELQVIDLQKGTGKAASKDSEVTVHYTGALAKTGIIFESSLDAGQPVSFPLNQVIKGWQQGMPGMKEGGKRRLIIPAELAYGKQGSPPKIGPNEPLVFDVELISVN